LMAFSVGENSMKFCVLTHFASLSGSILHVISSASLSYSNPFYYILDNIILSYLLISYSAPLIILSVFISAVLRIFFVLDISVLVSVAHVSIDLKHVLYLVHVFYVIFYSHFAFAIVICRFLHLSSILFALLALYADLFYQISVAGCYCA
jgi:hypothetical protein